MTDYAKFVNENTLNYPPQNNPNRLFSDGITRYVSNYSSSETMLLEDGYLPIKRTPMPEPETSHDVFVEKYKDMKTYIGTYWVNQYVAPTLEEVKSRKVSEINLYRSEDYKDSYVTFERNNYPVDDVFFIEVNGALISQENSHQFKVIDGGYIDLDLIQIAQLQRLITEERRSIYDYSQVVKRKIWEASSVEEVENIVYDRGEN